MSTMAVMILVSSDLDEADTPWLPEQGVFEAATVMNSAAYQPRLDEIAASGFKVVLNYSAIASWSDASTVTLAALTSYASYAASKGLKVIWSLKDCIDASNPLTTFPVLATNLSATTDTNFVTNLINHLESLPATYGYYVQDEATAALAAGFITMAGVIRAADFSHPTLGSSTSNNYRSGDMAAVESAMDYVGMHRYPIGQFETAELQAADVATRVLEVVTWLAPKNKPFVATLQCIDNAEAYPPLAGDYPYAHWPSATEMTTLRNQFLDIAYENWVDCRLILWYSYFDLKTHEPTRIADLVGGAFATWTPPARVPTAPVGYWPFSEGTGTSIDDASANSNTGTASGAVWATRGATPVLDFDGVNDAVSIADNAALTPSGTDISICLWVKLDTLSTVKTTSQLFVYKNHSVSPWLSYQLFQKVGDNKIEGQFVNAAGTVYATVSSTALAAGQWYHIAYVKNGATARIYVNGVNDTASSATATGNLYDSNGTLVIGGTGGKFVDGQIYGVRLYNKALSALEVQSLAASLL